MEERPIDDPAPDAGSDRAVGHAREAGGRGLARGLEWFWRGAAMAAVRTQAGAGERELERRARVAAQLAANAYEPRERFVDGDATFLACELYREAVYWALRALARGPAMGTPDARTVWASVDPELLARAAADGAEFEALQRSFVEGNFADFAALPRDEQARTVERLRVLATVLLARLDLPQRLVDALWLERLMRCGLVVLALMVASVVALAIDRLGPDLAHGKPWRVSSDWGMAVCRSPAQSCDESPYYFFHTRAEKDPWVEVDLGALSTFTKVRVENREDCCYERAVPLVLEVSDDRRNWNQLAWRKQTFTSWTATLAPTTARFVRLRVKGQGPLHLKAVRVLP